MSAATEPAADPRSFDVIDQLLREVCADAMTVEWSADRPLLPSEARAILERHRADPSSTILGRSRETLAGAEGQLRLQAVCFAANAAALRAADAALVLPGNPTGGGAAETREVLTDAAELRALLPAGSAEAAALDAEHATLADAFGRASEACAACALRLQAERHRLHGRDYAAILLEALTQEEAERARRKKHAGRPVEGAPHERN